MNKTVKILALVSVISFVFLSGRALAQEKEWQKAQQLGKGCTMCAPYEAKAWDTFEASWLIGYRVWSPNGIPLGQISNFVIDQANGRIALVILSGVSGIGDKVVAVPYSAIVRTGEETFVLSFGNKELPVTSGYESPYAYEMTNAPVTSDLYGLPSKLNPDWFSEIYRYYGQEPYWTQKGEHPLAAMELYPYSKLEGAQVQTPRREEVARINDFVIDSSNGHVAFLVLSHVTGRPGTEVAVPLSVLSERGVNFFVLNMTKAKLEVAPSFNRREDMSNLRYAENVYKYFGQHPYWTEEGTR